MTVIEMSVSMDCPGCESKIRKALRKLDGVEYIDINKEMQKVTVMGWADQEKVLKTVRKTGRRVELWTYTDDPDSYNFHQQYYNNNSANVDRAITYYRTQLPPTMMTSSLFNYEKNGYASTTHFSNYYDDGYGSDFDGHLGYQGNDRIPPYLNRVDQPVTSVFSDENPHACSIM